MLSMMTGLVLQNHSLFRIACCDIVFNDDGSDDYVDGDDGDDDDGDDDDGDDDNDDDGDDDGDISGDGQESVEASSLRSFPGVHGIPPTKATNVAPSLGSNIYRRRDVTQCNKM